MLSLGLAANATIFAQADAIVLRPFRYPGVERAAVVASDSHQRFYDRESVAPGDFLDWREQASDVFDRLAAIEWWDPQYLRDGPPQQLTGFRVSPELFEILGEPALLGRTLTADDATGDAGRGAGLRVLAAPVRRASRRHRPATQLAGVSRQVVGVMAATFRVPYGSDVWAPLLLAPEAQAERAQGYLMVVGRLAPGVTVAAAEQRLQAILASSGARSRTAMRSAKSACGRSPTASAIPAPGRSSPCGRSPHSCCCWWPAPTSPTSCWRATPSASASSRCGWRLAPAAAGWRDRCSSKVRCWRRRDGSCGAARVGSAGRHALGFPDAIVRFVPGWVYLRLEPRTFAGYGGVGRRRRAALRHRSRVARRAAERHGRPAAGQPPDRRRRTTTRAESLAAAQIALTLALLVAAGLSLSALYRVTEGPLGFDPEGVLVGRVSLPEERYQDPESRRQLVARVLARLERCPP